jgi:hypothetical protein
MESSRISCVSPSGWALLVGGSLHVVENMKISENGTGMEVRASSCLIKDNLVNNANDYKVTIDERLLLLPLPMRLDLVASVPQIHTGAITGALIFEGTSLSGALGLFQRLGPFDSTFTVTLPEKEFSDIYAVLRREKPVYLKYNAANIFENTPDGETVQIQGIRIQTDNQIVSLTTRELPSN